MCCKLRISFYVKSCHCTVVLMGLQADEEKAKSLSAAALQISEQEARICHLEQQAVAEKELWLSEQEKLSSTVNKLEEDIKERDAHHAALMDQLQQVFSYYYLLSLVLLCCYNSLFIRKNDKFNFLITHMLNMPPG